MKTRNPIQTAKVIGENVTNETYLRQDAARGDPNYIMSRSELAEFARCPSRWRAGYKDGDTDATDWGSLIDCMVMQPQEFANRFVVTPETYTDSKGVDKPWNWNATACKEWREARDGKQPVKHKDHQLALRAVDRLFSDRAVASLLQQAKVQVMLMGEYRDEASGLVIPLKALVDFVPEADLCAGAFKTALGDFKTASSASPRAWPRVVFERAYHAQAALYLDLYNAATGEERDTFLHVIQENYAPFEAGKRMLSQEFIELGRMAYVNALNSYAQCLANDHWDTYDELGFNRTVIYGFSLTEPEAWMVKP